MLRDKRPAYYFYFEKVCESFFNARAGKMNIENIVKNTIKNTENAGGGKIDDLLQADFLTDDIKEAIFECWKKELDNYIDNYAQSSPDINASKGMYKCSLETWKHALLI